MNRKKKKRFWATKTQRHKGRGISFNDDSVSEIDEGERALHYHIPLFSGIGGSNSPLLAAKRKKLHSIEIPRCFSAGEGLFMIVLARFKKGGERYNNKTRFFSGSFREKRDSST